MAGRQIGIVVDRHRVLAESARRLHQDHRVPGLHCSDDDLAVGIAAAVEEQLTGRRAPVGDHRVGEFGGQGGEPVPVAGRRDPDRVARQLTVGQPVRVLAAAFDERVHQGVAVAGRQPGHLADVVTGVAQGAQQRQRTGRGVQTDRVADARVLRRVGREHQRQPLVRCGDPAQVGVVDRQAGHPGAPLRVGYVRDQPVVVDLLERERDGDDAPVELGHRDLGGHVQRAQPVVVGRPLRPRAGQAQPLQDWNIQGGKVFDVPTVVVTARADGRRRCPTGRQHRHHHRVRGGEQLQQLGLRGAQRRAVHRQRAAAGPLDRVAQHLDVGGVAGQLLGAVVQDGNGRAGACGGLALRHPPRRGGGGRAESEPGHQHGVAEERVQLPQVVHPALGQVVVGLHGDARRHRGALHQIGVGRLFSADHHGGHPARGDRVDTVLPGPVAAQDPGHHHAGAGEQLLEFALDQPRRVSPPVLGTAGAGGDQVGVGGREQQDGGPGHPSFVP